MFSRFRQCERIVSSDILAEELKMSGWYLQRCAQPILDCVALSLSNCSTVLFRLSIRPSSIRFLFKRGSRHRLGQLSKR